MRKYLNSELCLIWLDSFLGLEYRHKQNLYGLINGKSDIKELLVKGKDYIITEVGENEYSTLLNSANGEYLNFVLGGLERKGVTAITVESDDYPESLLNIPQPPLVLYCKGNVNLLNGNNFSIVGSRKSLPLSINLAKHYAETLSANGFTLVTGIAEGVDSAVLETAVNNGKSVISVIAGGFDNIYPATNKGLVERITENGLVVSENPPEVIPKPFHFPIRNRIIAGLSKGTLIVSGAKKSGTLYTAEYAEEYGRDLFAVPYSVGVVSGAGCNDLIKRGAFLTDKPEDILEYYGIEQKQKSNIELTKEQKEIISVLRDGEMHIEKICSALNKRVFEITPVLAMLEINKIVVKNGTNLYGLARLDLEE
ncbi:MAG: DNA-processing protein DprA [Clostridia bacterium]|nr:DNA-processing protein DprA [Clostridia bacterium]